MPTATTSEPRTVVRGLGEIALHVQNLDAMQRFYEEAIGRPLMTRVSHCAFFKIADGYAGHTQVLALFDRAGDLVTDREANRVEFVCYDSRV
jgi:catechol-2,3-dioxygenase